MGLNVLPDVVFAEKNAEDIEKSIVTMYEALSGRSLAKGDPVRIFLESISAIIIQQRIIIDYSAKQNLLAFAEGDYLDHLGVLVGTTRLPATAATTTLQITLSDIRNQNIIVPKGTRVTAGDKVFFSTIKEILIVPGQLTAEVGAVCTELGPSGNGYLPGQINKMVDVVPFVKSIVNITKSEIGSNVENDDSFRERIHQAPEMFSCAGPDGAYKYWAKTASSLVADVEVTSPTPGSVYLITLLKDGVVPGEEMLNRVREVCNNKKIRPLTDNLTVIAPTIVKFDLNVEYFITTENQINSQLIRDKVDSAVSEYVLWQKSKLGRSINPSELIARMVNAGAKRVNVINPNYISVEKTQVAIADKISINFGGVEDGY